MKQFDERLRRYTDEIEGYLQQCFVEPEEPQATRPVLSTMAATARMPCLRRLARREDAFIYLCSFLIRPAGSEQSG